MQVDDSAKGSQPPIAAVNRSTYNVLFGPLTRFVALPAIIISFFLPDDGLGVTVCWIKRTFDLPCPGCGLTRSMTCMSHWNLQKSVQYHPFGPAIYLLFVANGLVLCAGSSARERLQNWFLRNDYWINRAYIVTVLLFLTFGAVRLLTRQSFISFTSLSLLDPMSQTP